MTHHELRRRIGLAWNALRHSQPATPQPQTFTVNIHGTGTTATDAHAVVDALRKWKPKGDFNR